MAAAVVTISTRVHVNELERLARSRVDRDGVAAFAADTAVQKRMQHLRRLAYRLAADDGLDCYLAAQGDGATYLTVFPKAGRSTRRGVGWWGDPKVG